MTFFRLSNYSKLLELLDKLFVGELTENLAMNKIQKLFKLFSESWYKAQQLRNLTLGKT